MGFHFLMDYLLHLTTGIIIFKSMVVYSATVVCSNAALQYSLFSGPTLQSVLSSMLALPCR